MKKLVFVFAAFAAVSFSACGNKAANTESAAATDTTTVEAPSCCKSATTCDSTKTACDSTKAACCDSVKVAE